eukprot:5934330-Alexandrium_andersonii.AAC.1
MLEAARQHVRHGYSVVVLNMASRSKPGGGVEAGHGAQEENFLRRSDLVRFLKQQSWEKKFYPIPDRGCLLSRD